MDEIIVISMSPDKLKNMFRDVIRDEMISIEKKKKEKELMNARELCEYLGIHISTLNNWKAQGKIPSKRMGKRIFYEKAAINRALTESNYHKLKDLSWSQIGKAGGGGNDTKSGTPDEQVILKNKTENFEKISNAKNEQNFRRWIFFKKTVPIFGQ